MFKNLIFLLFNINSIWFTSFVKISKQYIRYYAKYSLFNLKGSKLKVTKMELELKSVFQWGCFNSIWYAEQYKQKVIRNKKCMKFTMGQHIRLDDDYGISLPSVGQRLMFSVFSWARCGLIGIFFSSWLSVSWEPFSLFPGSVLYIWLFPHGDILDK